jgi:hypothetical protein
MTEGTKKRDIRAFMFSVMLWGSRQKVVLFFSKHPTWEEVKDAFTLHSVQSWGGVPCGETPAEAEHSKFLRECGSIIYKACGDVKVEGFGSELVPPPKKKPYVGIVSVGEGQVELKRSY